MSHELGLDDDTLHEMVHSITGSHHISSLTNDEAITVIDRLKGNMKGFRRFTKSNNDTVVNRIGMANEAQIKKIYALMYELKSYDEPGYPLVTINKRLRGILKKYNKIDDVRFLTATDAWKVIEEIKKMIISEKRKLKRKARDDNG
ncbi:MAG: regulatory protein GemA [Bacillota bacterium]|nr:regulatory protein GemA [Bacillota bacterium]